jgi:hypothetical protein
MIGEDVIEGILGVLGRKDDEEERGGHRQQRRHHGTERTNETKE